MATIFDTAKYILHECGVMSTMKLQKLCYYSQAWSLVWDDEELIDEEFEAWANGPVCRELYDVHAGMFKIDEDLLKNYGDINRLTDNQRDTIDRVLDYYSDRDAQWLSTLTHMEDPWKLARCGLPAGANCSNKITKASMAEYYGSL